MAAPSALIHGGQEGQELLFILNSFHLSYRLKGHFFGIPDSLVQENVSGGKPLDPQITIVLPGDKHIKHCSSEKELKDQNLPMWRSTYIHIFAFSGSPAPCPRCAQASLQVTAHDI